MIFKTSTLCVIIVYLTLSAVGAAKDRSLVDIKAELPRLFSEIKSLEMELTKTFKEKPVIKGDYIDRINSIEKELTSMISQVENLQNRIERIIRDGTIIHTGKIGTLFREKNQVKQVSNGQECGITVKDYMDFQKNDTIEAFSVTSKERSI